MRDHLFLQTLNIPIYRHLLSGVFRVFLVPRESSDHHQPHCAAVSEQNALDSLVIWDVLNDMLLTKPFSK